MCRPAKKQLLHWQSDAYSDFTRNAEWCFISNGFECALVWAEQWFSDLLRRTRAGCCTEGGDQKYAVVGSKIEVSKSLRAGLKKWSFWLPCSGGWILLIFTKCSWSCLLFNPLFTFASHVLSNLFEKCFRTHLCQIYLVYQKQPAV